MLCDICKTEPAVYSDGVTWKRCSKCQYELTKDQPKSDEPPRPEGEGIPHQTIPGLTSIIIPVYMVNYPLFHTTGNCIGSVREHTDKEKDPYEIIVVDNGSPVQPPNLNSYYADKVVKWDKNEGVTKAWNAGIRCSFGEYIVLLNNDTQVYPNWLRIMKQALNEGGLDLVMAKPMYSLTEPFARFVEASREVSRWEGKAIRESFDYTGPTDFSCVMFRKELVDELGFEGKGLFDERYFNYAQDSDLFKRMTNAGKKYAVCKAVPIHHIIDFTGFFIPETPQIMNKDKATFAEIWERQSSGNEPQVEQKNDWGSERAVTPPPAVLTDRVLVRTQETGDKIYLVKENTLHWVKSPQVLEALGCAFGQEQSIDKAEFGRYDYGEPLDMANVGNYV